MQIIGWNQETRSGMAVDHAGVTHQLDSKNLLPLPLQAYDIAGKKVALTFRKNNQTGAITKHYQVVHDDSYFAVNWDTGFIYLYYTFDFKGNVANPDGEEVVLEMEAYSFLSIHPETGLKMPAPRDIANLVDLGCPVEVLQMYLSDWAIHLSEQTESHQSYLEALFEIGLHYAQMQEKGHYWTLLPQWLDPDEIGGFVGQPYGEMLYVLNDYSKRIEEQTVFANRYFRIVLLPISNMLGVYTSSSHKLEIKWGTELDGQYWGFPEEMVLAIKHFFKGVIHPHVAIKAKV